MACAMGCILPPRCGCCIDFLTFNTQSGTCPFSQCQLALFSFQRTREFAFIPRGCSMMEHQACGRQGQMSHRSYWICGKPVRKRFGADEDGRSITCGLNIHCTVTRPRDPCTIHARAADCASAQRTVVPALAKKRKSGTRTVWRYPASLRRTSSAIAGPRRQCRRKFPN